MRFKNHFALPFIVFCYLLVNSFECFAQNRNIAIYGSIVDTVNNNLLEKASVKITDRKGYLIDFTRTNSEQEFILTVNDTGKYILNIHYKGYADYVEHITVENIDNYNAGQIFLTPKTYLLEEFVFSEMYNSITLKGDTIVYLADSFKVRNYGSAEDLIKKLPGIDIDKDGNITVIGEAVQRIVVDGEEFFADDPAVIINGIQAKTVKTVEVYNKKSDAAEFTGIDDGKKSKTLDLKLKEEEKKGFYGKLVAGGGIGSQIIRSGRFYFDDRILLNAFKKDRKLSFYTFAANTGITGFGSTDNRKLGLNNINIATQDIIGLNLTESNSTMLFGGSSSGQETNIGNPYKHAVGLHYSNKWKQGKHHLNTNAKLEEDQYILQSAVLTEQYLPENKTRITRNTSDESESAQQYNGSAVYKWSPDSMKRFELTGMIDLNKSFYRANSRKEISNSSVGEYADIINNSIQKWRGNGVSQHLAGFLSLKKKLNKSGSSLILNTYYKALNGEDSIDLYVDNEFFASGYSRSHINQKKRNQLNYSEFSSALSFIEPLSDKLSSEVTYTYQSVNALSIRNTFERQHGGSDYDSLLSSLSNTYQLQYDINSISPSLRYNNSKLNVTVSITGAYVSKGVPDTQQNVNDQLYFLTIYPRAGINWNINASKTLNINYVTNTIQPNLINSQPVVDNINPFDIKAGNASLKQSYSHRIDFVFRDFKRLLGSYYWLDGGALKINDDIIVSEYIDNDGVRFQSFENTDGNYSVWGSAGFGKILNGKNIRTGIRLFGMRDVKSYLINGVLNTTIYSNYSFNYNLNYKTGNNKLQFDLDPTIIYFDNKANINDRVQSYFTGRLLLQMNYNFSETLQSGTNVSWDLRQRTSTFSSNSAIRWNGFIAYYFLKKKNMELRITIHDILNQNIGFSRMVNASSIIEERHNAISRYAMLQIVYHFEKK